MDLTVSNEGFVRLFWRTFMLRAGSDLIPRRDILIPRFYLAALATIQDQGIALVAVHHEIKSGGTPAGSVTLTLNEWREKAYARGVSDGDSEAKRKAFKRAFDVLNADRFIGVADPYVWIAD
jgi:hypothetical protein